MSRKSDDGSHRFEKKAAFKERSRLVVRRNKTGARLVAV
jgi:hypothetical protein